MIGVHSPRFPFTQDTDAVAGAAERLGIDWPVAVDREFALWQLYEPHGWPAVFLWGQGGALRWYHLGEGDYAATEQEIREVLPERNGKGEWPPLLEPIRPSDVPDVKVIAPTPELFPGGSTEEPWSSTAEDLRRRVPRIAPLLRRERPPRRNRGLRRQRDVGPHEIEWRPADVEVDAIDAAIRRDERRGHAVRCGRAQIEAPERSASSADRRHEADVLMDGLELRDVVGPALAEEGDQRLDQLLGGAGAGGDADGLDALEPLVFDLAVVIDQVGVGAEIPRDLHQPVRVR
jgi:hypothetical protein